MLLSACSFIVSLSCSHSAVSFLVLPPGGAKVKISNWYFSLVCLPLGFLLCLTVCFNSALLHCRVVSFHNHFYKTSHWTPHVKYTISLSYVCVFPQSAQQVCLVLVVAIGVSVTTRRCATTWAELVPARLDGLEPSVRSVREASWL